MDTGFAPASCELSQGPGVPRWPVQVHAEQAGEQIWIEQENVHDATMVKLLINA